jgi:hypothetical protein
MKNFQLLKLTFLLLMLSFLMTSAHAQSFEQRALEEALNPDGTLKSGVNGSFKTDGYQMRTRPNGEPIFVPQTQSTTGSWDTQFAPTSNGVNNKVYAVVTDGASNVYVGGEFTEAGGISVNRIARYNTLTNTWHALGSSGGNGISGGINTVFALALSGDTLYVGGSFAEVNTGSASPVSASNIARFHIPTSTWSALGSGVNNTVFALTVSGNWLYVGGQFSLAGGNSASRVARYNTQTDTWSALASSNGNGVQHTSPNQPVVRALAVVGNDVYVAGAFTGANAGSSSVPANAVARFNTQTNTWSALASSNGNGLGGPSVTVFSMLAVGNEIYVAGNFTQANAGSSPITVNHVARFNTQTNTWSALGTTTVGVATQARSLLSIGNDLYVGGSFTTAGGVSANNVARFNIQNNTWSALGSGVNGSADALALSGDTLFVGGNFTFSGSSPMNRVARYIISANKWERLWSGAGLNSEVRALFVSGSDVYVGGIFSQAGDVSASRVARFNTQTRTWNPLGSGVNGDVYSQAGGNSANNVARFNTQSSTWHRLGTFASNGVTGEVRALAVLGRWVFVGGSFGQAAGSLTVNHIARFDTQSETWSAMGTGGGVGVGGVAGAAVNALAVSGSSVYAGGSFSRVNEGASSPLTTNNVARYDTLTNAWSALGTSPNVGVGGQVHALAISGDWLYAGGQFTTAGGNAANRIARFNLASPAWSSLGTGTNNGVNSTVFAIAASGDNVFVGGNFSSAGTVSPTYRLARFNTTSSTWSIVGVGSGNGVGGSSSPSVSALSLSGSGLFLGGNFTDVNSGAGLPSNYIGRYFGADATSAGTQTVTGNGTFTFTPTGVSIAFSGVLGTGNCTVSRYELPAQNISFTGTPPTFTSQYRFVITATGFTFTNAELRFNRTQIPNAGITNANTVRVYRRPTPGTGAFSILPNAFNPSFPDEVRATTTAFSEFILASDDNQLPVELTEFGFRKVDSGIELHWRTATELNNSGFEIERKSHGGNWNTLGFVRGRGTTTEAQSYSFLDRTATGKVQYRLKQIDFDGQFEYSNVIEVDAGLPKQFALEQNYPNPFNPTTTIRYQLPAASQVKLEVFDVLGKKVMVLVNTRQEAGEYNITLNAVNLSSGVYFYRLQSGNFVQTKKMMLVK